MTSTGAAAYLQVSALTLGGFSNISVALRDSADNVTFADVGSATFTAVTAAPAAERLRPSGEIRRYTAARWSFTGASNAIQQTATFMMGVARLPAGGSS